MMMSYRVHTHTHPPTQKTTERPISSNVHYVHVGRDN